MKAKIIYALHACKYMLIIQLLSFFLGAFYIMYEDGFYIPYMTLYALAYPWLTWASFKGLMELEKPKDLN